MGYTGEIDFQVRHGWREKSEKKYIIIVVDLVGFEPPTPKNPWSVDDAILLRN